ncbi:glycolate oxidase iron-sulfur subunit [Ectothiorhodospira magna]|uniref:Glycolate oxidase iron-sulfur subunit n=2 Tax=Ectothiorhodospira magna TaxID=867345 RepID=A0A1H8ZC92_9GAMM|nr:glycolate oxidase iron-sulfur subunit [Ectothiorhodospira magna]
MTNSADILRDTDRCVKCGLCLPHCPTYQINRNEGDSPRGRITLMQGLMQGALKDDATVRRHLEGCLGCRACETVCPSGVPFGDLMDATRRVLIPPPQPSGAIRGYLLSHSGARRVASGSLRLARGMGLGWLAGHLGNAQRPGMARNATFLADVTPPPRWPRTPSPVTATRGTVSLFTGCTAETFDGPTLEAAVQVLTRLGYEVVVPQGQVCCGAMDHHAGGVKDAAALARRNQAAFAGHEGPILSLNSGCRVHLHGAGGDGLGARVTGLCRLLADLDLTPLQLVDTPLKVAFHTPCTLRHGLGEADFMVALLQRLPGVTDVALPDNAFCCGGAGSRMLTDPRMADQLLAPKLEALEALAPDVLVTANVGCGLHLAAGIRRRGLTVPVLNPARLMATRLGPAAAIGPSSGHHPPQSPVR